MIPANVDQNKYSIAADQRPQTPPQENSPTGPDPFSAFYAARNMTYEELCARRKLQQDMMRNESEQTEALMTDAMRRSNIDVLISVANYEATGVPGMTPDTAVVVLQEILARPEYTTIKPLYPGLETAVEKRYTKIKKGFLPVQKKK